VGIGKKLNLLFIISLAFLLILAVSSLFSQGLKPYPGKSGESFDDTNPLWGPDGETLAFERIQKGGTTKYEIYMFEPFSSGRYLKSLIKHPGSLKKTQDDVWGDIVSDPPQNSSNESNYISSLRWIDIKKEGSDRIYKYVYAKTPGIHIGKLSTSITQEASFASTETSINTYPDYSSKNNMIAFASSADGRTRIYMKEYKDEYQSNLSSSDKEPGLQLTNTDSLDTMPKWSPDGKHIAYASREKGNMDIYVIFNALTENREVKQLTTDPCEETIPTWSPDGKMVAFYSLRDKKGSQLMDNSEKQIDLSERYIFDLYVVGVDKRQENVRMMVAEDVYRQEHRGPVWVNFTDEPGKFNTFILYITGTYNEICAVNIEKLLVSGKPEVIHIKGRPEKNSQEKVLLGYKYGNITGLDCTEKSFKNAGINCIRMAYSALSGNHQKRIYWALLYNDFTFDAQTGDQPEK
jgi:hypothetical protein